MGIPAEYTGREQAYVKHSILKTYLTRLLMIIGRGETVINYVDCFAGPWEDETDDLRSTSIGISLNQIKLCAGALRKNFNKTVKFRALYIEKDPDAFRKLNAFLQKQNHSSIEVSCMEGDYSSLIPDILKWCGDAFTFFFVDPKGWKRIIGGKTLEPLLNLERSEFLINLMYDFANRAVGIDKHEEDIIELLGEKIEYSGDETAVERQDIFLSTYRKNINKYYGGRTAFVPIERPGKDRVLYFLIYLTRHPLGINVFKEDSEKMLLVQRITQQETKLRKQQESAPILDLFADEEVEVNIKPEDNRCAAKSYLLKTITDKPCLIDYETWSRFLEDTDLYPTDFQLAMKELVKE
ncbi:MAG: three-Cys-motif partner protein TcmP, partial [Flavobacteriales bacterium]|nr:three-Cys-motif partner protein TcmP [Flavobacteriales bacterium]